MIVATAAKCRFCGEIFDQTLKKGGGGAKKGKLKQIASHHRNIQVCVLLIIGCWIGIALMIPAAREPSTRPVLGLISLIFVAVFWAGVVGLMIYAFLLGRQLYNTGIAILLAVLMLLPCANLLIALFVSQRASQLLKDNGYEVGLLGAKMS
jgi:hypothetical protein